MLKIILSALPAPTLYFSFSSYSISGQQYSENCSASVVDGPVVLPDLMIEFPNSTVISEEGANSLAHMFSPLRISDGGQYTCTATIIIPQAEIADHQSTVTEAVVVVCKYFH